MLTNLKTLRLARGLTQAQLGRRAGVSPYMISYIESGQRVGTMRTALALADALGVTVDALLRSPAVKGPVMQDAA